MKMYKYNICGWLNLKFSNEVKHSDKNYVGLYSIHSCKCYILAPVSYFNSMEMPFTLFFYFIEACLQKICSNKLLVHHWVIFSLQLPENKHKQITQPANFSLTPNRKCYATSYVSLLSSFPSLCSPLCC